MKSLKAIVFLMIIAVISFVLFTGCSTEVNPDYEEPEGGYHQFGGLRHSQYMNTEGATFTECMECHGADLSGVPSGTGGEVIRSCYTCHNPLNHMSGFENYGEHDNYLKENHWNISECYLCHTATTTSEFSFGGSCASAACHGNPTYGPEACFTCHGDFMGSRTTIPNSAPPNGLEDETATSDRAVGAHLAHLEQDEIFAAIACDQCHIVPTSVNDSGHLDTDDTAEIVFGSIAGNGEYDMATGTCSSTDCHGSSEPVWTVVDGTYNACGTCHNYPEPPAENHDPELTQCSMCHGDVIDENGNIIDPSKHGNGHKG